MGNYRNFEKKWAKKIILCYVINSLPLFIMWSLVTVAYSMYGPGSGLLWCRFIMPLLPSYSKENLFSQSVLPIDTLYNIEDDFLPVYIFINFIWYVDIETINNYPAEPMEVLHFIIENLISLSNVSQTVYKS